MSGTLLSIAGLSCALDTEGPGEGTEVAGVDNLRKCRSQGLLTLHLQDPESERLLKFCTPPHMCVSLTQPWCPFYN